MQVSQVESLEARALLSNAEFDVNTKTLTITFGTTANENVVINPPTIAGDFSVQIGPDGAVQNFAFSSTVRVQMTAFSIQEIPTQNVSANNRIDIQIVTSSLFPALTQITVNGGVGKRTIRTGTLVLTLGGRHRIFAARVSGASLEGIDHDDGSQAVGRCGNYAVLSCDFEVRTSQSFVRRGRGDVAVHCGKTGGALESELF